MGSCLAVADVLRPLDGAEAQIIHDGRRRLSTAPRESGRLEAGEAGAAARRERRRSHPPPSALVAGGSHDASSHTGVSAARRSPA